jgi:hypothetical protein
MVKNGAYIYLYIQGDSCVHLTVLIRHSAIETEEDHEKPHSEYPVTLERF